MDDTDSANLLFWSEFAIIESSGRVVECIYISTSDCECLCLMCEAEIAYLVFIVDIRYLSQFVRLFLCEKTEVFLLRL